MHRWLLVGLFAAHRDSTFSTFLGVPQNHARAWGENTCKRAKRAEAQVTVFSGRIGVNRYSPSSAIGLRQIPLRKRLPMTALLAG
jgi:hypothetical protein